MCLTRFHKLDAVLRQGGHDTSGARAQEHRFFREWGTDQKKLIGMINADLSLRIPGLARASQGDYAATTPPPAGTAFGMPPLPTFPSLHDFDCGGGTLFKLSRAEISGGSGPLGSAGKQRGIEVVVPPKSKRRIEHLLSVPQVGCVHSVTNASLLTTSLRQPRPVPQPGEGLGGKAQMIVRVLEPVRGAGHQTH